MDVFGKLRRLFRQAPPANRAFIEQMRASGMPAGPVQARADHKAREKTERVEAVRTAMRPE